MLDRINYLLLQVRNLDDPMRQHEVDCFARELGTTRQRFRIVDLLNTTPSAADLDLADVVLLGGSGHYSAAGEGEWLTRSLDVLRELHASARPTFASCWGFQAMARALDGTVIHDLSTAEVGTHEVVLTEAGLGDPVFGSMGPSFLAQMGHEDRVDQLPPSAVLLASSGRTTNQAYRLEGTPIYCTQFHPELRREDLYARVEVYPEYIERIARMRSGDFMVTLRDSPEAAALLPRFVETVLA